MKNMKKVYGARSHSRHGFCTERNGLAQEVALSPVTPTTRPSDHQRRKGVTYKVSKLFDANGNRRRRRSIAYQGDIPAALSALLHQGRGTGYHSDSGP
jgi:hypothetical protein